MFYTIKEVADILKVNPKLVTTLAKTKQLSITIVGKRSYRISDTQLQSYLDKRTTKRKTSGMTG